MPRPSEKKTFLLPTRIVEAVHGRRLLDEIFGQAAYRLEQGERPDFLAIFGNRLIGIEVTQPRIKTLPQDIERGRAEITYASDQLFDSLKNGDCRVAFYGDHRSRRDGLRGFDPRAFAAQLAQLLETVSISLRHPTNQLSIAVCDGVADAEANGGYHRVELRAGDFPNLPNQFAIDACSGSQSFTRPFIEFNFRSWRPEDESENRQRLIEAVCRKYKKALEFRRSASCEELWLLVHYPSYGSISFQAGDLRALRLEFEFSWRERFDRVFFLERSSIYELSEDGTFSRSSADTPNAFP